jgi:gamma-glutamyltranspeptidase/glutathione hydrolase
MCRIKTRLAFCALPIALLLPALAVCFQDTKPFGPTDPRDAMLNQGPKAEAKGDKAMVSTQLASSTLAALEVLRDGGNAVDAALTALFVQQVHDYHMVFLFGSMSGLIYEASSGKYHAISAVAARPKSGFDGKGKAVNVTIGGTVKGAAALAERFGTRSWASYLQPAVAAAEEGAIVTSFMYWLNAALFEFGYLGDLHDHMEARKFYMPDGHLVGVGHPWKMPALAETLRRIGKEGSDFMYTGGWGRKFVDAVQAKGGQITLQDMADYQPSWVEPVRFTYRGRKILGSPPPDTGGLIVGYNLNILEDFDLAALGPYTESAQTLEILARAFGRVAKETRNTIRDPLNHRIPADLWLSKTYGQLSAEFVRNTMPLVNLAANAQTSSASDGDGEGGAAFQDLGSDHIVIADAQGNWISLLHTIHGGSPGVFIDGVRATGSGSVASSVGPGRRVVLPITAIMIEGDDGKPWLAMGTPGNPPQPVTEVLLNILDFKMTPKDAVEAPRFWAFREKDMLEIESRLDDKL